MNDATQKLVDEARDEAARKWRFMDTEGAGLLNSLADALEAAQRPPVSPEVERLVDEARRWAGGSTTSPVGASLVQDLADALEAAQRPPVEYPHKSGDVIVLGPGVFVARDGSVLNWEGENYVPQRPPVSPEVREALEWAGIKALVESAEVPTGVRALLLGEVVTIREAVDAEPVVRVILDALLAQLALPVLDEKEVAS